MPPSRRKPGSGDDTADAVERFRRSWEERFDRLEEQLREERRRPPRQQEDDENGPKA